MVGTVRPGRDGTGRGATISQAVIAAVPPRSVRIGAQRYPVVLPSSSDPRLHLAAVIISLQVLGQTVLRFELSIAQILVALATCAFIEVAHTFWDRRVLAWPASALLTGNGVAFILRVNGTEHGDWWSLDGWYIFAATAALGLVSKYVIRVGGRPLFNPSNLGLVVCFVVLGTTVVNPLDFWWGPMSPGLALALAVIVAGALLVTRRLGLLATSLAFWLTFSLSLGLVAAQGHCMTARWSMGPVCGAEFWRILVLSPEVLVFMFFMITDPRTVPAGRVARIAFGASVGVTCVLLIAPQRTEFGSKVALLGGLVVMCALRPLLERVLPAPGSERDDPAAVLAALRRRGHRATAGAAGVAVLLIVGGLLAVVGRPAREAEAAALAAAPVAPTTAIRPALDVGELPPVTVEDDVARVDAHIDGEAVATDVLADIEIVERAVAAADATLAATATTGSAHDAVVTAIGRGDGVVPVPGLAAVASVTVAVLREGDNPQAPPKVSVRLDGTDADGAARIHRFVVRSDGTHYLLSELPSG